MTACEWGAVDSLVAGRGDPAGSACCIHGLYVTGAQGNLSVAGTTVGPLAPISPYIFTAHVGLDIAVFKYSRITVGALFANYDQGASELKVNADGFSERVRVRSNNILPTLDFIWAGF